MQLVQTHEHVMIMTEMVHHARIIPLLTILTCLSRNGRAVRLPGWEGDTSVITSKHFYPEYGWRNTSANLRIEERFSWVNENTLDYDFTCGRHRHVGSAVVRSLAYAQNRRADL